MTLDEMEKNIDELSLEDLLDAMEEAKISICDADLAFNPKLIDLYNKRLRQYRAFLARILRMDAEMDEKLEMIEAGYAGLQYEMNKQLAEKDKENEQLVVLSEELVKKKDKLIAEKDAENQRVLDHLFSVHYCNCSSWEDDDDSNNN